MRTKAERWTAARRAWEGGHLNGWDDVGELLDEVAAAYETLTPTEDAAVFAEREGTSIALRELIAERDEERTRVTELEQRRDELLALVRAVSLEAPDAGEAHELRGRVAALIAEVGTLRATNASLERTLRSFRGETP